ncbi:hypothetical protein ABE65_011530 [Fictibacillus phosphorivorans]|uniref:Uncharacterized protein n=1 Tax=Fictibacillus phosphorivorans TaxID=1221500 RepID=A0A160IM51_9BACL|nr:hypothetical protein [Fictibacillus phosphorivorans]ANC77398.1 hypothetical protein ABE65_011530 [Fictibacillus phosphorivorans]
MERRTSFFLMFAGFIIMMVLVILYVFSLRSQLSEVRANQENYKQQAEAVSNIEPSQAEEVNKKFLKSFFTYDNPSERYQNIKPLMTEAGYRATHPSGNGIPQSKEDVSSSISNIKHFKHEVSKTEIEFLNEFKVTTDYNGVGSTEKMVIKTELVYVEGVGWKIEDISIV